MEKWRRAKPAGIAADAIEQGTRFGFWEVVSPEVIRAPYVEGGTAHSNPRQAFLMCRCTACGVTEKPVRRAYLLNGHSTSCGCLIRRPAKTG